MWSVRQLLHRRLMALRARSWEPTLALLQQGTTPEKLSLTLALGVLAGMMPVFGIASLVCAGLAVALRLNMVAIQLTHYAATPLQVLLFIPFIRLGEWVFRAAPLPLSFTQLRAAFQHDAWGAMQQLWQSLLLGVAGWLVVSLPLGLLLYFGTLPLLRRYRRTQPL